MTLNRVAIGRRTSKTGGNTPNGSSLFSDFENQGRYKISFHKDRDRYLYIGYKQNHYSDAKIHEKTMLLDE